MARLLKQNEVVDYLFPPSDSGWYQHLFHHLTNDEGVQGFEKSQISIITYNYDRSLEAYLYEALIARYGVTNIEARDILGKIPIVHVHGLMGNFPDVPYTNIAEPDELLNISKEIKIIHEVKESVDGYCSPEFEEAHNLLEGAERIFFMGFGFHPDNIRRLRYFEPDNISGKEVFATIQGLGPIEVESLKTRLAPFGIPHAALHTASCNQFFSYISDLS